MMPGSAAGFRPLADNLMNNDPAVRAVVITSRYGVSRSVYRFAKSRMTLSPGPGSGICVKGSSGGSMNMSTITGLIFNIQRDSTEDGPGIRTTVFLKGCSMRCPWCHNPEGIKPFPELVWYESRCIGDAKCVKACPRNAITITMDGVAIDRTRCDTCEQCAGVCPANALEVLGKSSTAAEIAAAVLRDRVFYQKSGGGVTISGGEPSLQAGFSFTLMQLIRKEGIHVALDTCGGISWETLSPLVKLADLVLYDIKLLDKEKHKRYTGISLDLVLENARNIAKQEKPMWVRTPVIPGYTDSEENIRGIARLIADKLPTVERFDILAFNNTCMMKYRRLDQPWLLEGKGPVTEKKMELLAAAAQKEGLEFVRWSGMTGGGAVEE